MKIAAIGAGGVNGYFGARLVQGGADVSFLARGKHLTAIREKGLTLESPHGSAILKVVMVESAWAGSGASVPRRPADATMNRFK